MNVAIVHEDNHLLAVNKPAGLPSQPDASGDPALDGLVREFLREKYHKPGRVYLALLHRLDRPTSGLVLLAKTDKAASRMAGVFRRREIEKTYLAVVERASGLAGSARLTDILEPAGKGSMRVAAGESREGRTAGLSYTVLRRFPESDRALLAVRLETGVKHQIRCQLAWRGSPVAGDFRYGPKGAPARPVPVMDGGAILLHAWRAGFEHPVKRERTELTAEAPAYWTPFLDKAGLPLP